VFVDGPESLEPPSLEVACSSSLQAEAKSQEAASAPTMPMRLESFIEGILLRPNMPVAAPRQRLASRDPRARRNDIECSRLDEIRRGDAIWRFGFGLGARK
jgi:hypothetical protein